MKISRSCCHRKRYFNLTKLSHN